jgi:hypothetical protein
MQQMGEIGTLHKPSLVPDLAIGPPHKAVAMTIEA